MFLSRKKLTEKQKHTAEIKENYGGKVFSMYIKEENIRRAVVKTANMLLTDEVRSICKHYVDNEYSARKTGLQFGRETKIITKIVGMPHCKAFIQKYAEEKENKSNISYNWKLYKLKKVIENFIHDEEGKPLTAKDVSVAISAMAEANKMQGHYSAEKTVNLNLNNDTDLQQAREEARKMLIEGQKEK